MAWLRRIRGAMGMGVTWAVGWALGGLMIGVASKLTAFLPWHYFFDIFDAPLPVMALPGFIAGVLFSVAIAGRFRKFEELSVRNVAGWGALGGLLLSLVPATIVTMGLGTYNPDRIPSVWWFTGIIAVPITLFSSLSACGYLLLARTGKPASIEGNEEVAKIG